MQDVLALASHCRHYTIDPILFKISPITELGQDVFKAINRELYRMLLGYKLIYKKKITI